MRQRFLAVLSAASISAVFFHDSNAFSSMSYIFFTIDGPKSIPFASASRRAIVDAIWCSERSARNWVTAEAYAAFKGVP